MTSKYNVKLTCTLNWKTITYCNNDAADLKKNRLGGKKCILCAREYKSNIYSKCGHEMNISLAFLLNEFEQKVVYVIFQSLCVSSYLSECQRLFS